MLGRGRQHDDAESDGPEGHTLLHNNYADSEASSSTTAFEKLGATAAVAGRRPAPMSAHALMLPKVLYFFQWAQSSALFNYLALYV